MFSKKVDFLLKKLDVENSVIAGYSGCSPANFSRLRSGARNYTGKSTTVKKLWKAYIITAVTTAG